MNSKWKRKKPSIFIPLSKECADYWFYWRSSSSFLSLSLHFTGLFICLNYTYLKMDHHAYTFVTILSLELNKRSWQIFNYYASFSIWIRIILPSVCLHFFFLQLLQFSFPFICLSLSISIRLTNLLQFETVLPIQFFRFYSQSNSYIYIYVEYCSWCFAVFFYFHSFIPIAEMFFLIVWCFFIRFVLMV